MGDKSVLLLWVVKVCHCIRVVKISGEKMNGGQKKLGGTFQGGKKVAAFVKYATAAKYLHLDCFTNFFSKTVFCGVELNITLLFLIAAKLRIEIRPNE